MHPMMKRSTAQDFKSHVHTSLTEGLKTQTNVFDYWLARLEGFESKLRKDTYIKTHCACALWVQHRVEIFKETQNKIKMIAPVTRGIDMSAYQ